MIMNKILILITIIAITFFLTRVYPKMSIYSINSAYDGGCFTVCENEKEIHCNKTSCTFMCIGDSKKNCDK